MNTLNVKKGDNVVVNSGENKGKTGKVLSVNVEKKTAIVEGINIVKKSTKPNAKYPQGGIIEKEAPIHVSKLNRINENGKAIRSNGKVTNIKINK
ncbi:MAG: 50S ribosomal protein L24 [Bacteroidales bacterium]|jgi:large subunit ribosomal protein L24|nr:50S ribosomal protein L24 [Bacteroidales bacterium]